MSNSRISLQCPLLPTLKKESGSNIYRPADPEGAAATAHIHYLRLSLQHKTNAGTTRQRARQTRGRVVSMSTVCRSQSSSQSRFFGLLFPVAGGLKDAEDWVELHSRAPICIISASHRLLTIHHHRRILKRWKHRPQTLGSVNLLRIESRGKRQWS